MDLIDQKATLSVVTAETLHFLDQPSNSFYQSNGIDRRAEEAHHEALLRRRFVLAVLGRCENGCPYVFNRDPVTLHEVRCS